jgi:diguanylate cyclase (GGDEF)-like protein
MPWGALLVDPLSQQIVGFDQSAANWFGLDTKKGDAEDFSVSKLNPFIKITDAANTSDQPLAGWLLSMSQSTAQAETCPVEIRIHHPERIFLAELQACRLATPAGFQLLVTIRPLDIASNQPIGDDGNAIDALTGLADRRALAPRLALWQQQSSAWPFAVLFLDLDNFKQVNDRHGHAVGDRVLRALAKRWQRCIRDDHAVGDLLVRYGGDEFVVLLSGISNCEEAQPVVTRLKSATREPIELEGHEFVLNASIGVAIAPTGSPADLDALIASADSKMYATKRQ